MFLSYLTVGLYSTYKMGNPTDSFKSCYRLRFLTAVVAPTENERLSPLYVGREHWYDFGTFSWVETSGRTGQGNAFPGLGPVPAYFFHIPVLAFSSNKVPSLISTPSFPCHSLTATLSDLSPTLILPLAATLSSEEPFFSFYPCPPPPFRWVHVVGSVTFIESPLFYCI